jgi:nucleoid-associated protein YgaU
VSSPPKELPETAIKAGEAAIAGAAAAEEMHKPKGAAEGSSANDERFVGIPIRNSRASQPHDLNESDDPRGDESLFLFDNGPESSAVSPPPVQAESLAKSRRFEVEAPVPKTKGRVSTVESQVQPRANRVETVYHRVESGENFWTISRLFYGSGRYYVALWSANKKTVPVMDALTRGQVIVIPPQEDLDPALIEPARIATTPATGKTSRIATAKGGSRTPGTVPSSRKSFKDSGIDPIIDDDDERFAARGRAKNHERDIDDGIDRVSDTVSERPSDLPIHKVRPRESLRSIARDRLGDSRRADEIFELNRALLDNPDNLVPGQVIELPEDAKPGRRR